MIIKTYDIRIINNIIQIGITKNPNPPSGVSVQLYSFSKSFLNSFLKLSLTFLDLILNIFYIIEKFIF